MNQNSTISPSIAIVGLGYVGLPLALAFAKQYTVIGFDINEARVFDLENALEKFKNTNQIDTILIELHSKLTPSEKPPRRLLGNNNNNIDMFMFMFYVFTSINL